ncbi:MAG: hypothetical protein AAGC68_14190, partial [Verrucomicrobiota bacterium]
VSSGENRQPGANEDLSLLPIVLPFAMKRLLFSSLTIYAFLTLSVFSEEQAICPIMVDTEIDVEEVVEYEGVTIYLCCTSCMKAWEANPEYYAKFGIEEGLLPQFNDTPESLKDVELMEQKFCPLRNECVVNPDSPFVEYKGKKIYFFRDRDIERRWINDPDGIFAEAREAGLLPQFD